MRLGNSLDFHPFKKGRKFILGGIEIDYPLGLDGISDADPLIHSISEAILGALALGDLGTYFNSNNALGLSSLVILKKVDEMMKLKGYKIVNIDSTVLLEEPKLKKYILKMREQVAKTLEIDVDLVSIKATTMEEKGIIGRKEGCMAIATVLLEEV